MKGIMRNNIFKKFLIVLILIVMTSNFIMPNYVYAETVGEKVVSGIFYLIAYLGDAALSLMQGVMMGTSDIEEFGQYKIKYSPGIIFSNAVPALDIDFMGATESDNDEVYVYTADIDSKEDMIVLVQRIIETGTSFDKIELDNSKDYDKLNEQLVDYGIQYVPQYTGTVNGMLTYQLDYINNTQYALKVDNWGKWGTMKTIEPILEDGYSWGLRSVRLYLFTSNPSDPSAPMNLYKIEEFTSGDISLAVLNGDIASLMPTNTIEMQSTAFKLKDNIARWYVALRTFALVGLLSVLVYLGIRIILSSTSAQDKAKYKNMLKDWVIAICILFILHYIMAFMLGLVTNINDMLSGNILVDTIEGDIPSDGIMNTVRSKIGESYDNASIGQSAGFTLMYFVLVILTGVFTFQYLKRVVYMAFLTMIAPLIALTYPIDKVKDGKGQAFSFWLREYIVNCLIQPVHLLLYTLFVSQAIDFATENILYSIVAITFLMPAEKIIKQMFGIKSESSYNTLGAVAGGAMVMNMLNKVKGVGGKGSKGGSDSSSGGSGAPVRTATRNGLSTPGGVSSGGSGSAPGGGGGPLGSSGSAPGGGGGPSGSSGSASGGSSSGGSGSASGGASGSSSRGSRGTSGGSSSGKTGAGGRLRQINGANALKSAGRWTGKTLGAIVGGTIGAAAAMADGDFQDFAITTYAGITAGKEIGNNVMNVPGNISNAVKKKVMGEEAYNNAQFDKQFYKSAGYKKILSSSTLSSRYSEAQIKEQTQMFLDNGITDAGTIQKALEAEVSGDEYKSVSDLGITDMKKYSSIKKSKKSLGPNEIAARMAIAKNMPTELYNDKDSFVRYAKRYGIQEKDAESLFNDIDDFA